MLAIRQSTFGVLAMSLATVSAATEAEHEYWHKLLIIHGVLMGLAFAIFFPVGAIILHAFRFKGMIWFHAGWQAFALTISLIAFGIGVYLAVEFQEMTASNGHTIIGIIVISVLTLQPITGYIAHLIFKKRQHSNAFGIAHRWLGRVFLFLGVINGGLGFQLSDNTNKGLVAYSVLGAFFFSLWFGLALWRWWQGRNGGKKEAEVEKGKGSFESVGSGVTAGTDA